MSNNINTMQIWCYINYHWNNTKIKSIQSKMFQCLFYMSKTLNLGHLVKVLWKYLNNTYTKGSSFCDVYGNLYTLYINMLSTMFDFFKNYIVTSVNPVHNAQIQFLFHKKVLNSYWKLTFYIQKPPFKVFLWKENCKVTKISHKTNH